MPEAGWLRLATATASLILGPFCSASFSSPPHQTSCRKPPGQGNTSLSFLAKVGHLTSLCSKDSIGAPSELSGWRECGWCRCGRGCWQETSRHTSTLTWLASHKEQDLSIRCHSVRTQVQIQKLSGFSTGIQGQHTTWLLAWGICFLGGCPTWHLTAPTQHLTCSSSLSLPETSAFTPVGEFQASGIKSFRPLVH